MVQGGYFIADLLYIAAHSTLDAVVIECLDSVADLDRAWLGRDFFFPRPIHCWARESWRTTEPSSRRRWKRSHRPCECSNECVQRRNLAKRIMEPQDSSRDSYRSEDT